MSAIVRPQVRLPRSRRVISYSSKLAVSPQQPGICRSAHSSNILTFQPCLPDPVSLCGTRNGTPVHFGFPSKGVSAVDLYLWWPAVIVRFCFGVGVSVRGCVGLKRSFVALIYCLLRFHPCEIILFLSWQCIFFFNICWEFTSKVVSIHCFDCDISYASVKQVGRNIYVYTHRYMNPVCSWNTFFMLCLKSASCRSSLGELFNFVPHMRSG